MKKTITDEIVKRTPLFKPGWMSMIKKMTEHPHAPVWNTKCGDRLTGKDINIIKNFEKALYKNRKPFGKKPGKNIIKWIKEIQKKSIWFTEKLEGIDIENNFHAIPFMQRENIQKDLEKIVSEDDFERLIINPTSGTTGQPILPPSHHITQACYDPLIQFILKKHGLQEKYNHKKVAAIQVCAQDQTITYNTVHSYLDGAGFAKINILARDSKEDGSCDQYIKDMAPVY